MTPPESKALRFIERHIAEHDGVPPSFEEMREGLGGGIAAALGGNGRRLAPGDR